MNREILFKAKRIDWRDLPKEQWWVEGDVQHTTSKNIILIVVDDYKAYPCDSSTLCQYTGLTDKNGKRIWENDIVRRTDLHVVSEPSVGFIEYDLKNTSFLIHWTDKVEYSPTYHWKDRLEVIGNIFDNPDLLEAE